MYKIVSVKVVTPIELANQMRYPHRFLKMNTILALVIAARRIGVEFFLNGVPGLSVGMSLITYVLSKRPIGPESYLTPHGLVILSEREFKPTVTQDHSMVRLLWLASIPLQLEILAQIFERALTDDPVVFPTHGSKSQFIAGLVVGAANMIANSLSTSLQVSGGKFCYPNSKPHSNEQILYARELSFLESLGTQFVAISGIFSLVSVASTVLVLLKKPLDPFVGASVALLGLMPDIFYTQASRGSNPVASDDDRALLARKDIVIQNEGAKRGLAAHFISAEVPYSDFSIMLRLIFAVISFFSFHFIFEDDDPDAIFQHSLIVFVLLNLFMIPTVGVHSYRRQRLLNDTQRNQWYEKRSNSDV